MSLRSIIITSTVALTLSTSAYAISEQKAQSLVSIAETGGAWAGARAECGLSTLEVDQLFRKAFYKLSSEAGDLLYGKYEDQKLETEARMTGCNSGYADKMKRRVLDQIDNTLNMQ